MKNQKGYTHLELLNLVSWIIIAVGTVGWVANIIKLVNTDLVLAEWAALEVLRALGIVILPLGAVLGFL